MSVLRRVVATLIASWRAGILLAAFALMAVIGYSISEIDRPSLPADADAVTVPPLVRAEPVETLPTVTRVASGALTKPVAAPALPQERTSLVRELQKALARAGCYRGPINGVWGNASKDAMRGFVEAVNAQLPVDNPDETLVALVESNDVATCAAGRAIYTGALSTSAPSDDAHENVPAPATPDDHSMIAKPWAAPEMLVPPKEQKDLASNDTRAPASASSPSIPSNNAAVALPPPSAMTASPATKLVEVTPVGPSAAPTADDPPRMSGARFENDRPLPDAPAVEPELPNRDAATPRDTTAQKRPKSTKRKARPQGGSSVSDTFYSIQKSISSMFE